MLSMYDQDVGEEPKENGGHQRSIFLKKIIEEFL